MNPFSPVLPPWDLISTTVNLAYRRIDYCSLYMYFKLNLSKYREIMSQLALDRRDVERFNLQLPVCISVQQEWSRESLYLSTSNVSSGGAYFETESGLPVGTDVEMEMFLIPKDKQEDNFQRGRVKVTGKVIRTSDSGMAILFRNDYEFTSLFLS